jgi:hypothetical protein
MSMRTFSTFDLRSFVGRQLTLLDRLQSRESSWAVPIRSGDT